PVFAVTAGHFGDKYFAANGATWAATISNKPEKAAALAYTCLTCGRCKVRCPVQIDGPAMSVEVRRLLAEDGQQ
ncbi:MAG: 4Fe-4S dicluster domain-containing protein, partial [Chloroflexi bacterium]|nr:4Fe-4S dicluster domain-containing protein [Chloroflexota bacterium]